MATQPVLITVHQVALMLSIGRTAAWELVEERKDQEHQDRPDETGAGKQSFRSLLSSCWMRRWRSEEAWQRRREHQVALRWAVGSTLYTAGW